MGLYRDYGSRLGLYGGQWKIKAACVERKTFVPVAWELTPEPVRMGSMPTFEAAQRAAWRNLRKHKETHTAYHAYMRTCTYV